MIPARLQLIGVNGMTASKALTPEASLAALGFTELEAAVYCELQRGAAATDYRLAKAIGKAPAIIYEALATLTQTTAPAEVPRALRRAFEQSRVLAKSALTEQGGNEKDDRIYQLKSSGEVMSGPLH